jgi:hypothetical protein
MRERDRPFGPGGLLGELAHDERLQQWPEPAAVGLCQVVGSLVDEVGGEYGVDEVSSLM